MTDYLPVHVAGVASSHAADVYKAADLADHRLQSLMTNLHFNSTSIIFGSLPGPALYHTTIASSNPSVPALTHKNSVEAFMNQKSNNVPIVDCEKNQKAKYVDNIVDTTSLVIQSIWAEQYAAKKTKLVSLRVFIQEVLRRSRTTYSTLQTALFYLFRIKNAIVTRLRERAAREAEHGPSPKIAGECNEDDLIGCGRRMFLAALMVASKYLQDKNYRNRAWAKISGLSVHEINSTEIAFLKIIDYNLFVSKPTFDRWYALLHSQVAGATASKDDHTMSAEDALFGSTPSSSDAVAENSLSSPASSISSSPARVPSPSHTSTGSEEESDAESVRLVKSARVRQYVQGQKRLQRAPDSGIGIYMSTPEASKLSPDFQVPPFEHRPIARPRHLSAAPLQQSTNNVVVAPYIPGVRPVVRTTSAAVRQMASPLEGGKRKHAESMVVDDGSLSYASYSSFDAAAAVHVPDVCSISDAKKFRADEDGIGFGFMGEDATVVEEVY